jgi:SAM-dependent methyltransferase
MNALALTAVNPQPGERILEAGFGGGALLHAIRAAGAEPVGVDVSEAMVRRALKRGFSALEGAAEGLPLPDRSVDKAVSVNSIYFWPNPAAAIEELARVVRPGGKLVLCFQAPEAVRAWPGHLYGFRVFEADEVVSMMKAAGFSEPAIAPGRDRRLGRFFCITSERL